MRYLCLSALCCLLSFAALAQKTVDDKTKGEYKAIMKKFMAFYNKGQTDSVMNMYSSRYTTGELKNMWPQATMDYLHQRYGTIKSFEFKGYDEKEEMCVFKAVLTKSLIAICFNIEDKDKMGKFGFDARSQSIDAMVYSK